MKYIQFKKPVYTHLILGTGNSYHLSFDFLVKVKTFTSRRGIWHSSKLIDCLVWVRSNPIEVLKFFSGLFAMLKLQLPLQRSYLQLKFVLFLFQHPFIVDLIYAFQTGGKLYLILEYLSGMFSSHYLQMS